MNRTTPDGSLRVSPIAEILPPPPTTLSFLSGVAPGLPAPDAPAPALDLRPSDAILAELAELNLTLDNPGGAALVDQLADGADAVLTGQQVGLFGGPLLTAWKALEAIGLARAATAAGRPTVAMFWMATQDDDLAELYDAGFVIGEEARRLAPPEGRDRRPVGDLQLPPEPGHFLAELGVELGDLEPAFRASTYTESFARVLLAALAGCGDIVFVDPRRPALAAAMGRCAASALERSDEVRSSLERREEELRQADLPLQVDHRPSQCHVFILEDGQRRALHDLGDGIGPRDAAPAEIDHWRRVAAERPDQLIPSVLLRPLVVSMLLPQAMVVLGPSEVAYWAQSSALFELFDVPLPAIRPRPHVALIDPISRRLLQKLELDPIVALAGRARIEATWIEDEGPPRRLRAAITSISDDLESLDAILGEIDPTLLGSRERLSRSLEGKLSGLVKRAESSWLRRDETRRRQLDRVLARLWPDSTFQERFDSVLSWRRRDPGLFARVSAALEDRHPDEAVVLDVEVGASS